MKAEMIAVGTEILTGQIVNTNAQFLSETFADWGIDVYFQTAVGDNADRLESVLSIASKRSELVVLCGGLGPTDDDLTKQTLARFLGKKLVFDQQALDKLDQFFASRPGRLRTPNNERQAQLVEGSQPLPNWTGLAVGGLVEQDGVTYVVLPGPPSELKPMVQRSLRPLLDRAQTQLYSRVLRFFGIGESQLVTMLEDLITHQTDPTIAPYAKIGEVTLRLSTKASSQEEADEKLNPLEQDICSRANLSQLLYGYGEEYTLAKAVVDQLESCKETLAIVDSFTAGLVHFQLSTAREEVSQLKGGELVPAIDGTEEFAKAEAQRVRDHYQTTVGVSVFARQTTDSRSDNRKLTLFVGVAKAEGVRVTTSQLGGYPLPQTIQIASLHVLHAIRQALLTDENLL